MTDWIIGILAALAAAGAWIVRGFFAERTEARLTKERNAALTEAEGQKIKAEAKTLEAEVLHRQQEKEGAIHAADTPGIASRLDDLF